MVRGVQRRGFGGARAPNRAPHRHHRHIRQPGIAPLRHACGTRRAAPSAPRQVLLKHIRPVRLAPTRLRKNGALSERLVKEADAAEIERAGHPQRLSAQRPAPKGPPPPKPLPKYSGWQADKRAIEDCIARLTLDSGWSPAELAAQPAWRPTFEQLATAHFTEQKQAGWFREVDGKPNEREPTPRQVAEMLADVVPLLIERRAKVCARTAAAAATRREANIAGMQHAQKLKEAEAQRVAAMRSELTAAVADGVHIEWVDSATGDTVRALSLSGDLRRLASVEQRRYGLLAKVRVTAAGLSQAYLGQRPSGTGAGTTFQGSVAEWKAKLKVERPGGSGEETEWGRTAWAAWQEDERNKDRSAAERKADPVGSAALPQQQGYAPLRHLLADGPDGDQVFVGAMPANALRDGRRNSTPHHTLRFRAVPGKTHEARGPCGLVALQHAAQHSAESLGLVASQTQQSFDGPTGLANQLRNARTALGRAFSLGKWHQGLDEALSSRGTERLVIYCLHGNAEDVQELASLVAACRQQEALQAAERAAVERAAAERACAAGKRRGHKRALPLRRATLQEVASRADISLVGHYVVLDLSLGIMYTEPEVYIVSATERREPALLRATLMRPPFQLIFETDTVAAQHTRVLMLDVLSRSAVQSNYSNPKLLALLREDCLAFQAAEEAKASREAQAKRRGA